MKILIIDDNAPMRELIRTWLERDGFEVFEAENGKDGVATQQLQPVDLILCDLIMPVQEGIETITYFRDNYPEVGIIAISGGGKIDSLSYLTMAEQLGAWKTFNKPLNMPQIMEAIKAWQLKSSSP